ncbi:MAG: hypothetical protein AABZ92_00815, partial [Verrucomicrobiota bacterium]
MTAISLEFFMPVRFEKPKTFKQYIQEGVDDYFYLGGKSVFVISGEILNGSQAVRVKDQDQSRVKQVVLAAIKVISYMTVIIPLIMLIAKASFRLTLTHKFHIVSENEYEFIVSQRNYLIVEKVSFWEFFLSSYNRAINDDEWNSIQGLSFLIAEFQEVQGSLVGLLGKIGSEHTEYQEKEEALKKLISKLIDQTTDSLKALQEKIQNKTPRGLENVGNTCYMNSALQPLLAVRNFEQIIPD